MGWEPKGDMEMAAMLLWRSSRRLREREKGSCLLGCFALVVIAVVVVTFVIELFVNVP